MLVHWNQPDRGELAECAYLIYLGQGSSDELANWLRTEREVKADCLFLLRRGCLLCRSP